MNQQLWIKLASQLLHVCWLHAILAVGLLARALAAAASTWLFTVPSTLMIGSIVDMIVIEWDIHV